MKRYTLNYKMTVYWWTHWFWITLLWLIFTQSTNASPIPFSSHETISTSLKSALVQNDNSFQQTSDQQKIASGSKSVPLTFETSDTDDIFGGSIGSEIDAENAAKNKDWLVKPSTKNETIINSEKPKLTSIKLDKNITIPDTDTDEDLVKSLSLSNVNSTNATATTMLTSVTEPNAMSSSIQTSTTQTTKLTRVHENDDDEHILTVKSLNISATETNQNDQNDTVEIIMTTDDSNATEIAELSERKSKVLIGFSEEAKVVNNNNISSRSTLQVTHLSQSSSNDDRLSSSSEALFGTDTDNGGIVMNAGVISIIVVGVIGSLSAFSIMVVYIYRRRFLNKPQALSEPDSSGYIDDSIRDNSDELYSLDNDSFLNSLEAMTIQNFWADNVKHTKL